MPLNQTIETKYYRPKLLSNKVYRSTARNILNNEVNPRTPYNTYYDKYTTSDGTNKSILSLAGLHLQQNRNILQPRYQKYWRPKHPKAPKYDEIPKGYKFNRGFTINSIGQYIKSNILPTLNKKYPNLNKFPFGMRKSLVDFEYHLGGPSANKFKNMQKALRSYSDTLGTIQPFNKKISLDTFNKLQSLALKAKNEMLYSRPNADGTYTIKSKYYNNFPTRAETNANRLVDSSKRIGILRTLERVRQNNARYWARQKQLQGK